MRRGQHVYLRALEGGDAEVLRRWNFDEEISYHFPSRWPVSQGEQSQWLANQERSADKKKLMICRCEDDRPIGMVGVLSIDQVNKNCEIGITVGEKEFHGSRCASEALEISLEFLFRQFNMHLVYARILERNGRARRFFERSGFREGGVLRDMVFAHGTYQSWVWVSMTQREWSDSRQIASGETVATQG